MNKVVLNIIGMHCEACAKLIKMKLAKEVGVSDVGVDYPKKQALVSFDPLQTSVKNFLEVIADLGYQTKEVI